MQDEMETAFDQHFGAMQLDEHEFGGSLSHRARPRGGSLTGSFMETTNSLEHYGVKGMKWGVRKETDESGRPKPTSRRERRKLAKADKKWEKSVYSTKGAIEVHNAVADRMNNKYLPRLNNSRKYGNKDLTDPKNEKLFDEYLTEYSRLVEQAYGEAVHAVHGYNASGTKKAVYVSDENGERIELRDTKVKHAAEDDEKEPDIVLLLKFNAKGFITEANQADTEIAHDALSEDEFLMHYGVKGMKWGIRKRDKSAQDVDVQTHATRRYRKRIVTKGGKYNEPSEDAVKAAIARQKARKSTIDSLSNQELQALITRMNLEQNFQRLTEGNKSSGQQWAESILSVTGDEAIANTIGAGVGTATANPAIGIGTAITLQAVGAGAKASRDQYKSKKK